MKHRQHGFTLVELIIVIVIIAILATVTTITFTSIQVESRDAQRTSKTTIVSEGLEAYYMENGEYPSVPKIVNDSTTADDVADLLGIDAENLKLPDSSSDNALIAPTTESTVDTVTYTGSSEVNNTSCQTSLTGGCDRFTLSYTAESGEEVVINSRHDSSIYATLSDAPPQPMLSLSGSDDKIITAESSIARCADNSVRLVAKYSFRYKVNSGAWLAWSSWSASDSYTTAGAQGSTYYFQAQSRCDDAAVGGVASPASEVESYVVPINDPAGPIISVALSGTNVVGTVQAITCPAGTTAQYAYHTNHNGGDYGAYSAWTSARTSSRTANPGYEYGYQAKANCYTSATKSDDVEGNEDSYTHPYVAPTAPTVTVALINGDVSATASAVSCISGATVQYSYRTRINTGAQSAFSAWETDRTATRDEDPNTKYGYQFQARCYSTTTTSPAAVGPEGSYTSELAAPNAPVLTMALSGTDLVGTATAVSCPSGTTAQYGFRTKSNDGAYGAWTTWSTSRTYSRTANQGYKYGYQAEARCYSTVTNGGDESYSNQVSYTHPYNAPTAPTNNVTLVSGVVSSTATAVSCASGATVQYSYRTRVNAGAQSGYSGWSTGRTATRTATAGTKYGYQFQARCYSTITTSASATGAEDSYTHPYNAPSAPSNNVTLSGGLVTATATAVTCQSGATVQYSYRTRVNDDAQSAYSAWSTGRSATRSPSAGIEYSYQFQARCYSTNTTSSAAVGAEDSYTHPYNAPSAPSVSVGLSGSNVLATASAVTCQSGATAQYSLRSRINAGSQSAYSGWSTSRTASQAANQGVKYGYQAQARCTSSASTSSGVAGSESSYVRALNTPSTPSAGQSTSSTTTTYSISSVTCASGSTTRYQYRFLADWGYTSGWYGPYSTKPTPTFGSTSQGYQYTMQVQAHCYNANTTSGWSGTGSASYIRPVSNPSNTTFSAWRQDYRTIWLSGATTCGPGAYTDIRADIHTWDFNWVPTPPTMVGWYRDRFGSWLFNELAYRTSPVNIGSQTSNPNGIPAGSRWNMSVEKRCRNHTTGRASGVLYQESGAYAL